MRIYFIRHGDYNIRGLTSIGKKQIKFSCEYLKNCDIQKIYCSPLERCLESAVIIGKKLKRQILVDERLKEREYAEDLTSKKSREWFDNYLNMNYSSSKPEGAKEYFSRVREIIKEIISNNIGNVLVVGHSCNLYAIASFFFKEEDEAVWMAMGNGSVVCFETK